jgi:ABC-type uncharacterized transport system permease subunit
MIESILVGAVRGGTSMVFAAAGETVTERSGVVNLGVEGSMLAGALAAYAVGIETGSPWLGALAGMLAGLVISMVHAFMVIVRGANQIASGLAVTFLGLGLTSLYGQGYVSEGVEPFAALAIPGLSDVPFIGPILFDHDPLTYLSFAVAPIAWLFLYRTGLGLRIRAAGERPEVLATLGTSPTRVRWIAIAIGGALAGTGGAQLATAFARTWSEDMVAGRGFIAVALVIFAGWNPLLTVAGAYLFSGAVAFQLELQARGTDISIFVLDAIPYLAVLIVLAALSGRRHNAAPESLDKIFDTGGQLV